jgi:O-antigen/teichoic acid export membrane protein
VLAATKAASARRRSNSHLNGTAPPRLRKDPEEPIQRGARLAASPVGRSGAGARRGRRALLQSNSVNQPRQWRLWRRSGRFRLGGLVQNSLVYTAGRGLRMSLGFLTWLAAARLYPASQVGIATSAISAMMLCGQIGILGIDLAVVALFPEHHRRPAPLIDTAITVAVIASLLCGLIFVGIAAAGLHSLRVLATNPVYTALFLTLTALCAAWWVMDQTGVALRRSDHVLVRALADGSLTITGVAVLGILGMTGAGSILLAWVAAAIAACTIGLLQINRATGGYRFRPRLDRPLTRRLLIVGLPNFALSASDMAPGLILPLVAAAALSTRAAAYWYAVWMMAFAAYTIPMSFGLHLFAEIADQFSEVAVHCRRALRTGVAFGSAATAVLVVLGPVLLQFLGPAYAAHGVTPLRLAALAVVPMVFMKTYLFACRALRLIAEGTVAATVSGVLAVGLAIPTAKAFGLPGIAEAWLATQLLSALWAVFRLRALTAGGGRSPRPQPTSSEAALTPARTEPVASPSGVV